MSKVVMTLSVKYLPDWKLPEAIREIIQNARDAHLDGHTMSFEHKKDKLVVTSQGVTLQHSVFLLGETGKEGRTDTAGKFGEGLKLAMLVCARSGIPMTIRNGGEVWEPKIEFDDNFKRDVLVIHIRNTNKDVSRFQVEIAFPAEVWEEHKWKYLFVEPPPRKEVVNTARGKLLLGERYKGQVFVKGIHVCYVPDLAYGYDFNHADLDRDRRMLSSWDIREQARPILVEALAHKEGVDRRTMYEMVRVGQAEAKFSEWETPEPSLVDNLSAEFEQLHGPEAFPVANLEQAADLEHLGKRGVMVGDSLINVLKHKFGDINKVRKDLGNEVLEHIQLTDLTKNERAYLESAVETLAAADPKLELSLKDVEVVTFRDKRLLGMHRDRKALLARSQLASRSRALGTLLHEVAHRNGPDGDKAHVAEIERLWALVYEGLC
jgi:hypothetical protein